MSMQDPDGYHELERRLQAAGAAVHAAEAHGVLCGIASAQGRGRPGLWLEQLLGEGNTLSAAAQACAELLESVQNTVINQLHDEALGFAPLLPSDREPLPVRAQALGEWCGGYLYGLALGGVREAGELPDTVREVLGDFAELSRVGLDAAPDESDETAYAELVEFMRMSVLLVHEELHPLPGPARLH